LRALITGGAGFIGSQFVRMVSDGHFPAITEMTILDKLTYSGNLDNLKDVPSDYYQFVQGDIADEKLVFGLQRNFDVVINFAAESHVDRSINSSKEFVMTNIVGTSTLLSFAKESGVQIFLQVSTDEVYGSILEGSWTEDFPLAPNSPYSATKASADLLAMAFAKTHKLDVRITRCSNNYGPYQYPEKVIPLFVTNLLRDKKVPVYGKGDNIRDWLHVSDHCRGIYLALTKGSSENVYNIGGGKEISNLELTQTILKEMNFGVDKIDYVSDRLGHDFRYSLNHEKATRELGYVPLIDFRTGIQETIEWYKENRVWWIKLLKEV
jgi:dTDP-glucose 4,6-dehydratase